MPRRVKTPPRRVPPQPAAASAAKNTSQRSSSSRRGPSQPDPQQAGPSRERRSRRSISEPRRRSSSSNSSDGDSDYRSPRMRRSRSEQRRPPTRQVRALREIARLQQTTNLLIPKMPFARLIREVLLEYSHRNLRITPESLMCLQESAEIYLVQMFEDAYRCTLHRERVTLMAKDMHLALYLRERWR